LREITAEGKLFTETAGRLSWLAQATPTVGASDRRAIAIIVVAVVAVVVVAVVLVLLARQLPTIRRRCIAMDGSLASLSALTILVTKD
jgi:hypothetical protein